MNIIESLAREISRVSILREMCEETARKSGPMVNMEPMIIGIDASLELAFRAIGSNDVLQTAEVLKNLQEFEG